MLSSSSYTSPPAHPRPPQVSLLFFHLLHKRQYLPLPQFRNDLLAMLIPNPINFIKFTKCQCPITINRRSNVMASWCTLCPFQRLYTRDICQAGLYVAERRWIGRSTQWVPSVPERPEAREAIAEPLWYIVIYTAHVDGEDYMCTETLHMCYRQVINVSTIQQHAIVIA
jgi:hypothetical protein